MWGWPPDKAEMIKQKATKKICQGLDLPNELHQLKNTNEVDPAVVRLAVHGYLNIRRITIIMHGLDLHWKADLSCGSEDIRRDFFPGHLRLRSCLGHVSYASQLLV